MALYFNLWDYYDPAYPFQIFIGGYATGKSYSGLKGAVEDGRPFIYMRRTKTALEECCTSVKGETGNPFEPINENEGWNVGLHKLSKETAGIFRRECNEDGIPKPQGTPLGLATALPSLAKIRGAGLQRHHLIIYDEFIKELHEPAMRGEFKALMRGYETVNRNKEFEGLPPTILWMISNAEDIYNPVMKGLGIVAEAERMAARKQQHKAWKDRGLMLHLLESSEEFLAKKRETAIMKLMEGTEYSDVGLANEFANNDFTNVRYRRITGFRPVFSLDHAYVWRKKGEELWYVTYTPGKCETHSGKTEIEERFFRQRWGTQFQDAVIRGCVDFETYELKAYMLEHLF